MEQFGWSNAESPFHKEEQALQEKFGVRAQIEAQGRRVIRDYMPDQHRAFFTQLPFIVIGGVDKKGRSWASVVTGQPGFITSPDDRTLRVGAIPVAGDPLGDTLQSGRAVGLLGLEFHSRRRNRLNGIVRERTKSHFDIEVVQSFGNCPQYIQSRNFDYKSPPENAAKPKAQHSSRLGARESEIISKADTFFIATQYLKDPDDLTQGADVSHRGGNPGFVRIEDDQTLVWPDFIGNFHFNTLGNINMDPRAGLLFIDFETSDLVYLTGAAEVIWEGKEVDAFTGAERLVRFKLTESILIKGGFPLTWTFSDFAPQLAFTGSWKGVKKSLEKEASHNVYKPYLVERITNESEIIKSFYLKSEGCGDLCDYKPGQFLPIKLDIPGQKNPIYRTYTLSDAPGNPYLRLTMKRELSSAPDLPPGLSSNFFHDQVKVGDRILALKPRGKFILNDSDRPIVLLSGGVGITPMISMLNHTVKDNLLHQKHRPVWFFHGTQNGDTHAFSCHVRDLIFKHTWVNGHVAYSNPGPTDKEGRDFDSEGYINVDLLKSLLPLDDYEFYICGPTVFMESLYKGLRSLNIADDRIHYEFFGSASILRDNSEPVTKKVKTVAAGEPVNVTFAKSGVTGVWDPSKGMLLDFAEDLGLAPAYGCRSGICSTCATKVISGEVHYEQDPAMIPEGRALICSSIPHKVSDKDGGKGGLILDL